MLPVETHFLKEITENKTFLMTNINPEAGDQIIIILYTLFQTHVFCWNLCTKAVVSIRIRSQMEESDEVTLIKEVLMARPRNA